MERRRNPANGKVEGHLPLSVLQILSKIQELKKQGYEVEAIRGWFEADKIRQAQISQAPAQQFNEFIAKVTQPFTSTVEKLTQIQETQFQETKELKNSLRELLTRVSIQDRKAQPILDREYRGEPFSRISFA